MSLLWLLGAPSWASVVVVVDAGGALYGHRGDATPVAVVPADQHVALTVLSETGGWIEVTTRATVEPACSLLRSPAPDADIHLWIKAAEGATVLTRRVEVPWPQGGSLVFHAGYRRSDLKGAMADATWQSTLAGWEAAIPADAWGAQAAPDVDPPSGLQWRFGDTGSWDRKVATPAGPVQIPDPGWAYASTVGEYVRVGSGCLSLVARAPGVAAGLAPSSANGIGGLIGVSGMPIGLGASGLRGTALGPVNRISSGASLKWPDGSPSGTASGNLLLWDLREVGPLRCGKVLAAVGQPEVCVSPSDLTEVAGSTLPAVSPATASMGTPAIEGPLLASEAGAVIARKMSQIRYCYSRELEKAPALVGDLSVVVAVGADGAVSAVSLATSTLRNPAVEACVQQRFYQMIFPPHPQGSKATVPFSFTRPAAPEAR